MIRDILHELEQEIASAKKLKTEHEGVMNDPDAMTYLEGRITGLIIAWNTVKQYEED